MRFIGLLISLGLLFSVEIPYRQTSMIIEKDLQDITWCNSFYGIEKGKLYRLKGKTWEKIRSLPLNQGKILCFKGKPIILSQNSLYNAEGKVLRKFSSLPIGFFYYKEKPCFVFSRKLKCLGGFSVSFPSTPLILGKGAILGKDWGFLMEGKFVKLTEEISYKGLRKYLAWVDEQGLFYSPAQDRVCLGKECFRLEGKLVALGKAWDIPWVVTSENGDGRIRFLGNKLPFRLREQYLPYEPALALSNGQIVVVAGKRGPVQIFTSDFLFTFSLMSAPYNSPLKIFLKDIDSNGEQDIVAITTSKRGRKVLTVVHSFVSETRKRIDSLLNLAQRESSRGKYRKALVYLNRALFLSNYISLNLTQKIMKERAKIMKSLRFLRTLKNILPVFLLSIFSFILLFMLIKKGKETLSGSLPPPDATLETLAGNSFLHALEADLKELLNPGTDFFETWKERLSRFRSAYELLQDEEDNIRKASKDWQEILKKIKKSLRRLLIEPSRQEANALLLLLAELRSKINAHSGGVLDALRKAVTKAYAVAGEMGVRLNVNLKPRGRYTNLYPQKFRRFEDAFYNIILNAIESYEGIDRPPEKKVVIVEGEEWAINVRIRIKDFGKGIEQQHISKIFKKGWTSKRKGLGYGLYGVDQLFEEYGSLWVNSQLGQGTEFLIIFP